MPFIPFIAQVIEFRIISLNNKVIMVLNLSYYGFKFQVMRSVTIVMVISMRAPFSMTGKVLFALSAALIRQRQSLSSGGLMMVS
jgi:hypothetical protein